MDAWDRRESLVHASLLFLNGPKTGVDSGSLCVATMSPDSGYRHTGSQGADINKRAVAREITAVTPVAYRRGSFYDAGLLLL